MAIYRNTSQDSPIASVEFSPAVNGNSTFFHLKEGADTQALKKLLTQDLGQQVEAEANAGKQTFLVTRGDKSQDEIMNDLKALGNNLQPPPVEKAKFNPWVWRGNISIAGQSLQLLSGVKAAKLTDAAKRIKKHTPELWTKEAEWDIKNYSRKSLDMPVITFAVSNLLANFTNIIFGAQKSADSNQLAYLKKETNKIIAPYLSDASTLPGVNENRAVLRDEPEPPMSMGQKAHDFMQRHSVVLGEIGLRYFGALALAFPVEKWKAAATKIGKGAFKDGIKHAFNEDKFAGWTGVAYLAGKSIALFSKVPDPYDTSHKHTWVDTVREKYLFKVSSATEAVAAGLLAYNGLAKKKVIFESTQKAAASAQSIIPGMQAAAQKSVKTSKLMRDYPGGVGGMLFMSGLIIRIFAPFGAKEMDMRELNAHITDGLAQLPIDKIPQATAETAAFLTRHFKDKRLEFGKTYMDLSGDLYRYHNIALPGADGGVGPELASTAASPEATKTFARPDLKKPDLASMPRPGTFQDRAAASADATLQRA